MNYELAKELKDAGNKYVSVKQCAGCREWYMGGHKSFRCKPCQLTVRKELNKGWQKKYYEENKAEKLKKQVEHQRVRRHTDPVYRENMLTKGHNRRAYLAGSVGNHTTEEWLALVEKHERKCANCNEEKRLTRDHVMPISKGGTNDIRNIQPLCGSCNSSKGNRI